MITIETEQEALKPKGAPFYVCQFPFTPGETVEYARIDLAEDKIVNWPMVYILANGSEAYVGQTTSVANRMTQHGANKEKRKFTCANIIFNEEFNTSVITDYEHRLIGLMHADGKYRLTNKNDGMTDTNYFSKKEYSVMFDDLWDELRRLELADKTIEEIEESEIFKYSPYKGLTPDQRVALDKIMEAIENGLEKAEPIVVEGMPGTGKTVLAIYLLKMLKDDPEYKDLNICLVEPVTSLRQTLQHSLKCVGGLRAKDVIAPNDLANPKRWYSGSDKKHFDIVLVDEAHKLRCRRSLSQYKAYDDVNAKLGLDKEATQIDWIVDQAKLPVIFYDPLQSIGPNCLSEDAMRSALGSALDNPIRLDSQMRVEGGKEYLEYIRAILEGQKPSKDFFPGYDFVLHDDFQDFVESFEKTYENHTLTRMVAGYAWEWLSDPRKCTNPEVRDIVIDDIGLKWNRTNVDWVIKGMEDPVVAHEVGCIHSTQGYDLSYTYVIIGDDIQYNPESGQVLSNRAGYFDRNGKSSTSAEELDQYIKNIYYVLLTRGIKGTHIYAVNPTMREYLSQFVSPAQ